MPVAFISGPLDTGPDDHYFHAHYVPHIRQAIQRGDDFVIGPIPQGVDIQALDYLLAHPVAPSRITIFVTPLEDGLWGEHFRARGVNLHIVPGTMGRDRDAALTRASDYDILRLRTPEEARAFYGQLWREGYVTNTERNWKRRRGIAEDVVVGVEEINRSMGYTLETRPPPAKGFLGRWFAQAVDRRRTGQ